MEGDLLGGMISAVDNLQKKKKILKVNYNDLSGSEHFEFFQKKLCQWKCWDLYLKEYCRNIIKMYANDAIRIK